MKFLSDRIVWEKNHLIYLEKSHRINLDDTLLKKVTNNVFVVPEVVSEQKKNYTKKKLKKKP